MQESLLCCSRGAAEGGTARGATARWKGDSSVTLETGTGISSSSLEGGLEVGELPRHASHLGEAGDWLFWPRCRALGWDLASPSSSSAGHVGEKKKHSTCVSGAQGVRVVA